MCLPAYNTKLPSGLKISNRRSSPSSLGGLTITSRSTNSARPLYTHRSSPFPLLACRLTIFEGGWYDFLAARASLAACLDGVVGVEGDGDSTSDSATIGLISCVFRRDSSASLLLLVRNMGGLLRGLDDNEDSPLVLGPPPPHPALLIPQSPFHARSVSSPASQMRQSEKSRNSRSRGWALRSIWRSDPRLRRVRPGTMSWKGRLGVERCRESKARVCACV